MKLKYVGPFEAVDVPALGLLEVKRGDVVEATGKTAESLAAQDAWQRVGDKPPAKKTTAKTAAKKPAPGPAQTNSTEE